MSECYQNTYRNSSYYHASDDDLYISNVPEKEFTKSSNAKKEIHVVPSEIKKNYDNPDENITKIRNENSNRLKSLLKSVDSDIRRLLEFEINSIQKENENLRATVKSHKETIESLTDELYSIKEEAFILSGKLKKTKDEKKNIETEFSLYKQKKNVSKEKEIENSSSILKKNERKSVDDSYELKIPIKKISEKSQMSSHKFYEEKGIIRETPKKNFDVLIGPTSTAFNSLSLENDDSSDEDSEPLKFTREDLKECRFFTKDGQPNMRYKENRIKFLNEGTKVNGEPDMRFKKNIEKLNRYYRNLYQNN